MFLKQTIISLSLMSSGLCFGMDNSLSIKSEPEKMAMIMTIAKGYVKYLELENKPSTRDEYTKYIESNNDCLIPIKQYLRLNEKQSDYTASDILIAETTNKGIVHKAVNKQYITENKSSKKITRISFSEDNPLTEAEIAAHKNPLTKEQAIQQRMNAELLKQTIAERELLKQKITENESIHKAKLAENKKLQKEIQTLKTETTKIKKEIASHKPTVTEQKVVAPKKQPTLTKQKAVTSKKTQTYSNKQTIDKKTVTLPMSHQMITQIDNPTQEELERMSAVGKYLCNNFNVPTIEALIKLLRENLLKENLRARKYKQKRSECIIGAIEEKGNLYGCMWQYTLADDKLIINTNIFGKSNRTCNNHKVKNNWEDTSSED